MTLVKVARSILAGYDFPLHRDWLAWLALVAVAIVGVIEVRAGGLWSLLGAPIFLVLFGWVIGAGRNAIRGYRAEANRASP